MSARWRVFSCNRHETCICVDLALGQGKPWPPGRWFDWHEWGKSLACGRCREDGLTDKKMDVEVAPDVLAAAALGGGEAVWHLLAAARGWQWRNDR